VSIRGRGYWAARRRCPRVGDYGIIEEGDDFNTVVAIAYVELIAVWQSDKAVRAGDGGGYSAINEASVEARDELSLSVIGEGDDMDSSIRTVGQVVCPIEGSSSGRLLMELWGRMEGSG
jgi:hypothetical protein